jgi:fibronectin-binding autotransporter adhesin
MQLVTAKNPGSVTGGNGSTRGAARRASGRERTRRLLVLAAAGAIGSIPTQRAGAAIDTWIGSTGSTDWITPANWSDATSAAPVSNDSLLFTSINNSSSTTLTDTLTSISFNVAGITFSSGSPAYTMSGNAFALSGNVTNSSSNTQTINNAIILAGTSTFSGGSVTLGGVVSGTGSIIVTGTTGGGPLTAQTPTLTLLAANTYAGGTTINGGMLSIDGGTATGLGTGTVTINGGDLLLGSSKTVTNNLVLAGGGIYARDNNDVLSGGTLTINTGSTTSYIGESYDTKTLTIADQLYGSGNVTLAHTTLYASNFQGNNIHFSNTNVSTYNGTITIAADSDTTLNLDASYALASATINVNGAQGNAANSDTGKPFVFNTITAATIGGLSGTANGTNGNVALANVGGTPLALTVGNNNTNQTFAGLLTGAGSLIKIGTGTQVLSSSNTYSGGTTVDSGTLQLAFGSAAASNILLGTGALTLGAGGTLNLSSATSGTNAQTLASLTLNGAGTISMSNNGATSNALTVSSAITRNAGGAIDFVAPSGTSITLAGNTSSAFLGTYAFFGSGASETYAATNSSGNVIAATTTPVTGVNNFQSASVNYSYTSPGSPDTLTGNATANTAVFSNSGAQVIDLGSSGSNTLTMNGFLNVGAGTLTIQRTGGTGTLAIGSGNELVIGGPSNVTISAPISGASGALTDSNTATVLLTGVNTYAGKTTAGAGILQVGNGTSGSLSNSSSSTVVLGATLAFDQSTGSTYSGTISNSGTVAGVETANITNTLSGVISGTGSFTQSGTGTTVLSNAANSFTGNIVISAGTLTASTNGNSGGTTVLGGDTISTRTITVSSAGTLNFTSNDVFGPTGSTNIPTLIINGGNVTATRYNQLGGITLAGGTITTSVTDTSNYQGFALPSVVTVNGTAASTISSTNAVAGNTTIGGESLASTTTFNVAVTGASTADLTISAPLRNQGASGGAANLVKAGNGTMALTGTSSYTGTTTINAGILNAGNFAPVNTASAIGAGSTAGSAADLVFGGGTLQYTATIGAASTNRLFTIGNANGNSATLDSSSATTADTMNFTGTGAIALTNSATHSLTLTGSNAGPNIFAPLIADQTGSYATSVTKSGTGFWELTNTSTYTGATTIAAGGLGLFGGKLGTTAVAVGNNTNAAYLTATGNGSTTGGVIGGAVTVAANAAIDFSKDQATSTAQTLAVGSLSLTTAVSPTASTASSLTFNLVGGNAGAQGVDTITSTGNLTVGATGQAIINLGGSVAPGDYVLASYASQVGQTATGTAGSGATFGVGGTLGGGASGFGTTSGAFTIGTQPAGLDTFTLDDTTTQLLLQVSGTAAPALAYWSGAFASDTSLSGNNNWGGFSNSPVVTNWSDSTGTVDAGQVPNGTSDIVFSAAHSGNGANGTSGASLSGAAITSNLNSSFTVNSLTFNSTPASVTITGSGSTLSLNANASASGGMGYSAGTGIVVSSGAGPVTVSATTVVPVNSQSWTNNSSSLLSVSSAITGSATVGNTTVLTLSSTGTGGTTLSGVIGESGAGYLALIVNNSGSGITQLSGANTYHGGTTLSAGTLQLPGSGTLGNTSGSLALTAGTLDLDGTSQAVGMLTGTGGTILNSASSTVSNLAIGTGNATGGTFAGVIEDNSGTGGTVSVTKNGTGSITLSGANAFSGGTTINAGTLIIGSTTALGAATHAALAFGASSGGLLELNGNSITLTDLTTNATVGSPMIESGPTTTGTDTLTVNTANNDTFAGVLKDGSGTSLLALTKAGAGTLTLSNINLFTGGTTVSAGTLNLAAGGASGAIEGNLTINSNATVNLTSSNALGYAATNPTSTYVTNVYLSGGTINTTQGTNVDEGFSTNFILTGGAMTSTGGGAFHLFTGAGITSLASGTTSLISAPLDLRNAGTVIVTTASGTTTSGVDLSITGVIEDNGSLVKAGPGLLSLSGQSTFTGNVVISAGTIKAAAQGVNGSYSVLGGLTSTTRTITVNSGATLSLAINNVFGDGTVAADVPEIPSIIVNGGTVTASSYDVLGNITLSGATLTDSIAGNSSYQDYQFLGTVTVNGSSASTISNSGTVSATTSGDHLGSNTTFNISSTGGSGADLTISAPLRNQSANFGSAAGGLTKTGGGVLALTGSSTYTGGTTISAGTLSLTPAAGTNNIASSAYVNVASGAVFGVSGVGGAGANQFALNGTGTQSTSQILGGSGTVNGSVLVTNGTTLAAGTNKGAGQVNVNTSVSPATYTLVPATGTTAAIGALAAGNLTLGALTGVSGNFAVKVSDLPSGGSTTGTPGSNYDTVTAGAIILPATTSNSPAANPFNVQMLSYGTVSSAVTANTAVNNFNPANNYVWQIASFQSITNLPDAVNGQTEILTSGGGMTADAGVAAANIFTLDTSNFVANNPGISSSQFFLEEIGGSGTTGSLDIGYTATPEPGTALLVLAGAMPMLAARRRRREKNVGNGNVVC